MPKNIDDFNTMAGLILAHLYDTFPRRIPLDEREFVFSDGTAPDWAEAYFESHTLYANSVTWLRDAGYIWMKTENEREGYFRDCVLSPKGLEALKAMPTSLSGQSLGDSLITAVQAGARDTLKGLVSELVTTSYRAVAGVVAAQL